MVLLLAKINKLYSKLENNLHHHHHHSQSSDCDEAVLSSSLEGFFSEVYSAFNSKLSSEANISFSWIQSFFEMIPITGKAFAKLVAEIDHPMSNWESDSVDQYLKYSLTLLELFNSISRSLSRLGLARLSLSHGLSSLAPKHLKAIEPFSLLANNNNNDKAVYKVVEEAKVPCCSSKEEAIHRAMLVMEGLGCWVCGAALSSLCGGDYGRDFGGGFGLDSSVFRAMAEKKVEIVKEVRDLNESVARLVAAIGDGKSGGNDEAEELRERLEVFEKGLDGFGSEVDRLFAELLRKRNQLVHSFQVQKRKE